MWPAGHEFDMLVEAMKSKIKLLVDLGSCECLSLLAI